MTKQLIPYDARVIVKPLESPTLRPSGIVIPENAKTKPTRGEVLSVGAGSWHGAAEDLKPVRIPIDIEVGDVVIFDKFSGVEYRLDDASIVVILRTIEVLAIEREVREPATLTDAIANGGGGAAGYSHGGKLL